MGVGERAALESRERNESILRATKERIAWQLAKSSKVKMGIIESFAVLGFT